MCKERWASLYARDGTETKGSDIGFDFHKNCMNGSIRLETCPCACSIAHPRESVWKLGDGPLESRRPMHIRKCNIVSDWKTRVGT